MDNANNEKAFEEIKKTVEEKVVKDFYKGHSSRTLTELIGKCLSEYKFTPELCYKFFEGACAKKCLWSFDYLNRTASNISKSGITDVNKVEQLKNREARRKEMIELSEQAVGRRLNAIEYDRVINWTKDINITKGLIIEAFKANEFRTCITIKHIDDTLSEWRDHNIKTVDEAKEYCDKKRKENQRKWKEQNHISYQIPYLEMRIQQLEQIVSELSYRVTALEDAITKRESERSE